MRIFFLRRGAVEESTERKERSKSRKNKKNLMNGALRSQQSGLGDTRRDHRERKTSQSSATA